MNNRTSSMLAFAAMLAIGIASTSCQDRDPTTDAYADNAGQASADTRGAAPMPTAQAGDATASNASPETTAPITADATQTPATQGGDTTFLQAALTSGIAEVALSRHVQSNAASGDVQALAKRIADDHDALNAKLRDAGADAAMSQPDATMKAMDASIRTMKGADLDRAYLQHMADGHRASIARYEAEASGGSVERVRTLASEALPKLREHARDVESMLAAMK